MIFRKVNSLKGENILLIYLKEDSKFPVVTLTGEDVSNLIKEWKK